MTDFRPHLIALVSLVVSHGAQVPRSPLSLWERAQGEGEAWEGEAPAEPPLLLVVSHGAQRSGVGSCS